MSSPLSERVLQSRQQIVEVAQAMLDGKLGILEGCQRLVGYRWDVDPEQEDRELLGILGIQSQTDHLPVGRAREHWSPEALRAKDTEIAENETFFRESALQCCLVLVERYSRPA